MTRYTLHVPKRENGWPHKPFSALRFELVEDELVEIAGGFTTVDGFGGWDGDGLSYREPVRLYHIDTDDPEAERRLLSLAERVARQFKQEAVYLTRQEIQTYLVTAREEIRA